MGRFEDDDLWEKSLKKELEQQNRRKLRRASAIRIVFLVISITAIGMGLVFLVASFGEMRLWGLWTILGGIVIFIIGMLISTDIKAVKALYFANNGSTFHMSRDNPDAYSLYDYTMPIIFGWDRKLLKSKFATFWNDPENVWLKVDDIIEILDRKRVGIRRWISRLLDELEKTDSLDKRNKILIIESMSGRNVLMDEGGVHLICTRTNLELRMVEVMNKLMDFRCDYSDNIDEIGWDNVLNRYLVAVGSYKKACRKYGKKN